MLNVLRSTARASITISLIIAASKVFGLLRESIFAAYYGASTYSDAYKIGFGLPTMLLFVVSSAITVSFIPVFSDYIKENKSDERLYFINNTFNIGVLVSLVLAGVSLVFAPQIVRFIVPGYNDETLALTVRLFIISIPVFPFLTLYNLGSGYLNAQKKFVIPAVSGLAFNAVIISFLLLLNKSGIQIITLGSMLAVACQFAIQIPYIIKTGYRFRPVVNFNDKGFKKIMQLSLPIILGASFSQLNIYFFPRILGSRLDAGSISALDYANKISNLTDSIFVVSILTVIFPNLTSVSDNMDKFVMTLKKGVRSIILVCVPLSLMMIVLRKPIIAFLYERGRFDADAVKLTSIALGCYSAGILGGAFIGIFNRAFYSLKDTKSPMLIGLAVTVINIVLIFILVDKWGVGGIALSNSISMTIGAIMLIYRVRARLGHINGKEMANYLLKAVISAGVACLCAYLANRAGDLFIEGSSFIVGGTSLFIIRGTSLFISFGAGAAVYLLMLGLLGVYKINEIAILISNRILHRAE